MTQCDRLLRHMKEYGSITTMEAITEYGIVKPGSRISDLRKAGYPVVTETKTGKNRYGEPTRWAEYHLEGDGNV